MKKILGWTGVLSVLCASSYYFTGVLSQRALEHVLRDIHQTKGVDLKLVEYQRGWLSSQARIEWNVQVPETQTTLPNGQAQVLKAFDYHFNIPVTLDHGPVMFAHRELKFGLGYAEVDVPIIPEAYQKQISGLLDASSTYPRFQAGLQLSFLNQAQLCTKIAAFEWLTRARDASFKFLGFDARSSFSLDLSKMQGNLDFKGAKFDKKDKSVFLDHIQGSYHLIKSPLNLLTGSIQMALDSFQMGSMGKNLLNIKKFSMASTTKENQDLFNAQLIMNLEGLTLDAQSYGPGQFDVSLNQLDAKTLANIQQQLQSLSTVSLVNRQKILFGLLTEIPKLLAQNPELKLAQFSFKIPEGTVMGQGTLSIPKGSSNNPFQMLTHMQGQGHFQLPKNWLNAVFFTALQTKLETSTASSSDPTILSKPHDIQALVDKRMNALMTSGVLVQKDQNLLLDWTLDQGRLLINGQPFTPSMLDF